MKRLLTAGIFGTILTLTGAYSTANASIVSSGFLDEKLTEYALRTSLDLKANQSDFTELNTQISDSIDNLKTLWDSTIGELAYAFNPNKVNNNINGAFDLVEGFILHSMLSLTAGWTSDGIGLRFEKYNQYNPGLEGMFNGWTIYNPSGSETSFYPGLENISSQIRSIESTYGGLAYILLNGTHNPISIKDYNFTGNVYPLWKLSQGIDQIGTLPSGDFPRFPEKEVFFPAINQPFTYPTSLAELITAIYGNSETGASGLLAGIIAGYITNTGALMGILPNYNLAKTANDIANANAAKIGTVPDGKNLAGMIGTLPAGYDSVGAALSAIKGIAEDAKAAALAAIPDPKQEGSSGKFVLTVDIVGDNATYHWEKIDREGETTTTTE